MELEAGLPSTGEEPGHDTAYLHEPFWQLYNESKNCCELFQLSIAANQSELQAFSFSFTTTPSLALSPSSFQPKFIKHSFSIKLMLQAERSPR